MEIETRSFQIQIGPEATFSWQLSVAPVKAQGRGSHHRQHQSGRMRPAYPLRRERPAGARQAGGLLRVGRHGPGARGRIRVGQRLRAERTRPARAAGVGHPGGLVSRRHLLLRLYSKPRDLRVLRDAAYMLLLLIYTALLLLK
jgi:hypothetical protein